MVHAHNDLCLDTFLDCRAVQVARGAQRRALYREMHARLPRGAGVDFGLFQRVAPALVAEEARRRARAIRAAAAHNRVLERGFRLAKARLRRLLVLAGGVGHRRDGGGGGLLFIARAQTNAVPPSPSS